MIRSLEARDELLLAQLDRIQAGMQKAQAELSSGRRVSTASDAPDDISEILALRASLDRNTQIQTNLERVKADAATADSALQAAIQVMDRAVTLAVEGSGELAADRRAAIAREVRGLQEELVSLSATTVGDRYLFSGDMDRQPCYRLNVAAPDGVDRLASPPATRLVEHPLGVPFTVSKTAPEIFDDRDGAGKATDKNAFAALNNLAVALERGDQAGIQSAVNSVRTASTHLNSELGFYGAVENRVSRALTDAGTQEIRLKAALSERQDTDATAAILEFQQLQTNYSAALQMRANARQTSLFDYLK